MEYLALIWESLTWFLGKLPWIVVLLVVVFIHEYGHFAVARWCGVKVKSFSIGMGPEIVGLTDRQGTRWKIALLPIGGFVSFMDDANGASMPSRERIAQMTEAERAGSFHAKPLWQRAAIILAGPFANFISAILMLAAVAYIYGIQTMPAIVAVMPDNPAAIAGLKTGDTVVRIDGQPIADFGDLSRMIADAPGRALSFEVTRDGATRTLQITPEKRTVPDGFGGQLSRGIIGVKPGADRTKLPVVYPSVTGALVSGVDQTWNVITTTLSYVSKVLTGRESTDKIGGLPTVIDVSNQIATYGIAPLVHLIALLSVSIGLINLFPIPILDGGHLMYYAAEAIRGKPLSDETQEVGFRIGLAMVSMLMVLALYNDRLRMMNWWNNLVRYFS
jgi:regulator of sigma E protease